MHTRKVAVLLMALIMSIAAFAGEKQHMKIEIAVEGDEGDTEFSFDSKDAGFNLNDLEVGETREFDTKDGDKASVTRTDDGFEFDVDGQKIDMKDFHEMHFGSDAENVFVIKDASEVRVLKTDGPGDVTIVTGAALDETTKQKIRDALAESGAAGEVVFIDGDKIESEDGAKHRKVRVITKEVNVTN